MIDEHFVSDALVSCLDKNGWGDAFSVDKKNTLGAYTNSAIILVQFQAILKAQLNHFFADRALSAQRERELAIAVINNATRRLVSSLHNYEVYTANPAKLQVNEISNVSRRRLTDDLYGLIRARLHEMNRVLSYAGKAASLAQRATVNATAEREAKSVTAAEHAEGLSGGADRGAEAVESFADMLSRLHHASESATAHHSIVGIVVMKAFDFLLTPAMYAACYFEGKKVPATAHNNFRWGLSAIGLGLGITALVFPPAAGIVVVGLAALGLFTSGYTLIRHSIKRRHLRKEIKSLRKQQHQLHAEITHCKDELAIQEEILHELSAKVCETDKQAYETEQRITSIGFRIEQIKAHQAKSIAKLGHKRQALQHAVTEFRSSEASSSALKLRALSVGIGCIMLAGAVVALAFPPVGLAILAGAAIVGGVIAAAKPIKSFFKSVGGWIKRKLKPKPAPEVTDEAREEEPEPGLVDELSDTVHLDSTASLMRGLYGNRGLDELRELTCDVQHLVRVDQHLHQLIAADNRYGIAKFFAHVGLQPGAVEILATYKRELSFLRPAARILNSALYDIIDDRFTLSQAALNALTQGDYANALKTQLAVPAIERLQQVAAEEGEEREVEGAAAAAAAAAGPTVTDE